MHMRGPIMHCAQVAVSLGGEGAVSRVCDEHARASAVNAAVI